MIIPIKISCNGKTVIIDPTDVVLVDNDGSEINHESNRDTPIHSE